MGYAPGMPVNRRCSHCGLPEDPGARWCPKCGAAVSWQTPTGGGEPPPGAYLLVQIPGGKVKKALLDGPVIRVGRASECEVVVDHPRVSRIHATLELREGAYRLADAKSTGGTFLDDRPVHDPVRLDAGATIRLGRDEANAVTLVYHHYDEEEAAK